MVASRLASRSKEPIHLIVDSTGLKIFGAGEWSSRKEGKKRRSWRKLHLGVDERGRIVASVLTRGEADDAITAIDLIEDTDAPIDRFTADGAYDRRSVYRAVGDAGVPEVKLVIPPNCRAVPSDSPGSNPPMWEQRDKALRVIDEIGRLGWQRESGYRKQGRVENTFFRFKSMLGGKLRSRNMESRIGRSFGMFRLGDRGPASSGFCRADLDVRPRGLFGSISCSSWFF